MQKQIIHIFKKVMGKNKTHSYNTLDAKNLQGWVMSQYFATGKNKCMEKVEDFDVLVISDDSTKGCINRFFLKPHLIK